MKRGEEIQLISRTKRGLSLILLLGICLCAETDAAGDALSPDAGNATKATISPAEEQMANGTTTTDADDVTHKVKLLSPDQNVDLTNDVVSAWWNAYPEKHAWELTKKGNERSTPSPVVFRWEVGDEQKYRFRLYLSENASFKKAKVYETKKTDLEVYRLYRNTTYYWKVEARCGSAKLCSAVGKFKTADIARIIDVPGVVNMRDIGGYKTSYGKRVRQGMVYRSARLDDIKKAGKKILRSELSIKTDLDLRKEGEGKAGKKSPVLRRYVNIHGKEYTKIWRNAKNKNRIVEEMRVFADPDNYPIIFHCTYGRDRTGTLAFMLGALLGVGKKDLYRDYELTFLSSARGPGATKRAKEFEKLYQYMKKYKNENRSLRYNVEAFLRDNGLTKDEIDSIRRIMLY